MGGTPSTSTSTRSTALKYYTGLIETSKMHFYGRAAAGLSFSDSVLRTFTRLLGAVWFSPRPQLSRQAGTESDHPRVTDVPAATGLLRLLLGSAVTRVGRTARDGSRTSGRRCPPTPARGVEIRFGESAEASFSAPVSRTFTAAQRPR